MAVKKNFDQSAQAVPPKNLGTVNGGLVVCFLHLFYHFLCIILRLQFIMGGVRFILS